MFDRVQKTSMLGIIALLGKKIYLFLLFLCRHTIKIYQDDSKRLFDL